MNRVSFFLQDETVGRDNMIDPGGGSLPASPPIQLARSLMVHQQTTPSQMRPPPSLAIQASFPNPTNIQDRMDDEYVGDVHQYVNDDRQYEDNDRQYANDDRQYVDNDRQYMEADRQYMDDDQPNLDNEEAGEISDCIPDAGSSSDMVILPAPSPVPAKKKEAVRKKVTCRVCPVTLKLTADHFDTKDHVMWEEREVSRRAALKKRRDDFKATRPSEPVMPSSAEVSCNSPVGESQV